MFQAPTVAPNSFVEEPAYQVAHEAFGAWDPRGRGPASAGIFAPVVTARGRCGRGGRSVAVSGGAPVGA